MLNTNYSVPDEIYSRKHVYIVYFACTLCKFWRGEKMTKNTADAALSEGVFKKRALK